MSARRVIGVMLGALPLLVVGGTFLTRWRLFGGTAAIVGYVLLAMGGAFSVGNFYLSFVRAPLHPLRHRVEPRRISAFPMFGSLTLAGLALCPPSVAASTVALLLVLCDTGGVTWFVIATWNDRSLWERP